MCLWPLVTPALSLSFFRKFQETVEILLSSYCSLEIWYPHKVLWGPWQEKRHPVKSRYVVLGITSYFLVEDSSQMFILRQPWRKIIINTPVINEFYHSIHSKKRPENNLDLDFGVFGFENQSFPKTSSLASLGPLCCCSPLGAWMCVFWLAVWLPAVLTSATLLGLISDVRLP